MDTLRDKFFKQHLLSDQFLDLIEKNKRPMDELMSYYQCAIMEVETKFKVLNRSIPWNTTGIPSKGLRPESNRMTVFCVRSAGKIYP